MEKSSSGSGSRLNKTAPLPRLPSLVDPRQGGTIFVDKSDVIEDIIIDSMGQRRANASGSVASASSASTTSIEIQKRLVREQIRIKEETVASQTKTNIANTLRIAAERKDESFRRNVEDIDQAKSLLDVIDKNLEIFDETQRNKTRRQFEEWNSNVHGPIMLDIARQINSVDTKTLNKKKNEDYSKFLDITNRKSAIFRDIIIESEYDPLEPNRRAIKAKTCRLKDPTQIDAQKAQQENSMLGPNAPMKQEAKWGRDSLPVEQWASGKIEATPHGSFAKMMAVNPNKTNPTAKSSVVFDHFSFPVGKAAIDAEMPLGKRIEPITTFADPAKIYKGFKGKTQSDVFS